MSDQVKAVVLGGLNTDIVALGIKDFPKAGGFATADKLHIGPGGKSRNIADMLAHLLPKQSVAMLGRTVRDPYGLWKPPVDALQKASINTDFVQIEDYDGKSMPGIALISVNKKGQNQIILQPGVRDQFSAEDVDKASALFESAGRQKGLLVLSLECNLDTAVHAIQKAHDLGMRVVCDPGGIESDTEFEKILKAGVYLIKPNEDETELMTGIRPTSQEQAAEAAKKLQDYGIENVMITVGMNGAYLFTQNDVTHLPIPEVKVGETKDETGCGDQTTAALAASLIDGKSLAEAAGIAVRAGTLQFHKAGIQPVTAEELNLKS